MERAKRQKIAQHDAWPGTALDTEVSLCSTSLEQGLKAVGR